LETPTNVSTISGTLTFLLEDVTSLNAGNFYVHVRTGDYEVSRSFGFGRKADGFTEVVVNWLL
jgi:hypothetical protein